MCDLHPVAVELHQRFEVRSRVKLLREDAIPRRRLQPDMVHLDGMRAQPLNLSQYRLQQFLRFGYDLNARVAWVRAATPYRQTLDGELHVEVQQFVQDSRQGQRINDVSAKLDYLLV